MNNHRPVVRGLLAFCLAIASLAAPRPALAEDALPVDPGTLARITATAMTNDWAWRNLSKLTDTVGPRLSGSPQLTAAIAQVSSAMVALGAQVTLQPVKVPHWVRGQESAEVVDYPGRPAGLSQTLHLTALGGSSATPAKGLTTRVVVVHDMEELKSRAADIPGNIVLFDPIFDQRLADNGRSMDSYRQAGLYRFTGPSAAQALGAAAVLVRSIGGADFRLPHTGLTQFKDGQPHVPAAALAAEDADLLARLAAAGNVTLKLILTPQILPDSDSDNVIADWPGRDKAGEYVVVSGHLDSWDLATGATDDGVGVMAAAGVIAVLKELGLHPRRTIRFVAWTNEENGGHGGAAYLKSVQASIASQVAAIESDEGAGRSLGIAAAVDKAWLAHLSPVLHALVPIGATVLAAHDDELGSDIGPLQGAGVPGFAPLVDSRHYFDYHHTAADTLDKVEPKSLASQVATMAVLAYYLAEVPEPPPRFPVKVD
jgi:carboxypeptidase Q